MTSQHSWRDEDVSPDDSQHRPLVYLAVPYSHPRKAVRVARFKAVCKAAAKLLQQGVIVFSPISHSHPIAEFANLPTAYGFWKNFAEAYISVSSKLLVLKLDGWDKSVGVKEERAIAKRLGVPVEFLDASFADD